ncbi:MAG: dual OB domain-containing protein [Bryobacteraceae bacterium]
MALVEPEGLQWLIEHKPRHPKRPRAQFALGNAFHDPPVTDPAWVDSFRRPDCGLHPMRACGLPHDRKLPLTISLGAKFEDGYCYKLVAELVPVGKDRFYIRGNTGKNACTAALHARQ